MFQLELMSRLRLAWVLMPELFLMVKVLETQFPQCSPEGIYPKSYRLRPCV